LPTPPTVRLANAFLEPMTWADTLLMIPQAGSDGVSDTPKQRIADAMFDNFVDPRRITDAFVDPRASRKLIAELTGRAWHREFVSGALHVGSGQLRRVFGMDPTPLAPPHH
jgi:hypothetical protein